MQMSEDSGKDEASDPKSSVGKESHSTLAEQAMKLIDALEAELDAGNEEAWLAVMDRLASLSDPQAFGRRSKNKRSSTKSSPPFEDVDDPCFQLEQAYQKLQSDLIDVRQAVAQSIATEKQLEQQIQKNRDQADTWLNRAAMAVQQENLDLANQARQRMSGYSQAVEDLENQLVVHTESTVDLRQRLTDLEVTVQKAYTKKQVLISRETSARATLAATELLRNFDSNDALSEISAIEKSTDETKARTATISDNRDDTPVTISSESLAEAIASLEKTLKGFRLLAQHLVSGESLISTEFEEDDA